MAFNIEKAKQYTGAKVNRGGFNIEKAMAYGQPGETVRQPLKLDETLASITERRTDETSVRLPFSQRKAQLGGGAPTRFMSNLVLRSFEDLVVGGAKVAATVKNENISLPFAITHEPALDGSAPVTQQDFEPMNRSALDRINQLDYERPENRTLNLLQGTAEEVFLPILNSVDIIGLGSLFTRLTRKVTMSKEATKAFDTLGLGLLDDTSEAGVKRHFTEQVGRNIDLLSKGTITPEVFVKKMDDFGQAVDTLSNSKTTRFGKVGEKLNNITTSLEMERRLSKGIEDKVKFNLAQKAASSTVREAEKTKLPVKSVAEGGRVPIKTPEIKYTPDKDLPVIDYGKEVLPAKDKTPTIDIDEPLKNVNVTTKELIQDIPLKERKEVLADVKREYGKGLRYDIAEEKAYDNYLKAQDKRLTKFVPIKTSETASPFVKDSAKKINATVAEKQKAVKTAIAERSKAVPKKKITEAETPKKGVSKLAQRINKDLPEGSKIDEMYDTKTIKKELEKASDIIGKDETKALKSALNKNKPLTERISILMEMAQVAKNNGDTATQMALLSKMRILATDTAQGLNMFKAYGFSNPETNFMQEIVEARLGKISLSADEIASAGSRNKAYKTKVYDPVRKEITKKVDEAIMIKDVQKLFDDLIC